MGTRPNSSSWRTRVAATVAVPGPGRLKSRLSCATLLASPPQSLTTQPASKWNPIEHRLFSEISKHWAAEPLVSYEKMLGFIRNTSTKSGLVVTAYLDRNDYPTGLKPNPRLISSLALKPGKLLPQWNYTIAPNL